MMDQELEPNNNPIPILSLIRSKFSIMTSTQKIISDFIINNPAEAVKMSISELTIESGLKSESSVVWRLYSTKVPTRSPYSIYPWLLPWTSYTGNNIENM
jgi:hypothetical protein